MIHSPLGADKYSLDTPLLCIDMDKMQSNIIRIAGYCEEHKVDWRPDSKCHKSPAIAQMQIAAGAIGVTCAKVSEAEVFALGGVKDILIANRIFGERKWERVAALCRIAAPIVACDSVEQIEPLAAICRKRGVNVRVVIDVDLGCGRVGTQPGKPTVQLAQEILGLKGVFFEGIMGNDEHLVRIDPDYKVAQIQEDILSLCRTKYPLHAVKVRVCFCLSHCGDCGHDHDAPHVVLADRCAYSAGVADAKGMLNVFAGVHLTDLEGTDL